MNIDIYSKIEFKHRYFNKIGVKDRYFNGKICVSFYQNIFDNFSLINGVFLQRKEKISSRFVTAFFYPQTDFVL